MKFAGLALRTFALGVASTGCLGAGVPLQSQASFEAAIGNGSTAPSYVAVTIVDDRSGTSRPICVTANLFVGAVMRQQGLAFDASGIAAARRLILSTTSHEFHFSRPEAFANLPAAYSLFDLDTIRRRLRGLSVTQLREGFAISGSLHEIYRHGRWDTLRDATACVLFEHGLSSGEADMTGQLSIAN